MGNRNTKGSAICQDGRWFAICTVERGKRHGKRKWIPIPLEPGETLTLDEARVIAAKLQLEYDAGRDPTAVTSSAPAKSDVLVPAYVDEWAKGQTYDSAAKDRGALARYLPKSPLAHLRVSVLRPRHALAFVRWMEKQPSERGGTLAPRTVRNTCDALRRALNAAVVDELLAANPFDPIRGSLPSIADKDPTARESWEFQWSEVASLAYDARVPAERRVWNAIAFATGARPGELAVLRWRDWERVAEPLTRLNIRRARKSVSRAEGTTKTQARKPCPVHPALAAILGAWWETGWREVFGRAPGLDDLIVPSQAFTPLDEHHTNKRFQLDCETVGARVLHQYCTRHTWITRVQDDGADPAVVRWVTHAPPKSAWDGYTRAQWSRLCAEVAKLRFPADPAGVGNANANGSNGGERHRASTPPSNESSVLQLVASGEGPSIPLCFRLRRPLFPPAHQRQHQRQALTAPSSAPRGDVVALDALARWELSEIVGRERPN